jgi:hypothetical protein
MNNMIMTVPSKAGRWVAEMEEIARTFESVSLTSSMMFGAADFCRLVAGTDFGAGQQGDSSEVIRVIARALTPEDVSSDDIRRH